MRSTPSAGPPPSSGAWRRQWNTRSRPTTRELASAERVEPLSGRPPMLHEKPNLNPPVGPGVPAGGTLPSDRGAVVTRGLTRRYGGLVAVDNLTLTVAPGEIFGLLGPNGAGKTTTIKMLTTLLPPSDGRAWVAGHDVVREAVQVRRAIGYVPQLLSADGSLTARENLTVF